MLSRGYTMAKSVTIFGSFKNGLFNVLGLGLGIVLIAFVVLLIHVAFKSPLNHFHNKYATVLPQPPTTQPSAVQPTRGGKPVISVADLRNDIIAYYNTFITILVALLGASAIIGYLHFRHMSKREAEQRAHEAVEHYFNLEKTHRLLDELIGNQVEEWITDKDAITRRVAILEDKVEEIRQFSRLQNNLDEESNQD